MKYLDPKNDFIFKKVFGQHPDILKSFLNAMLPLKEGNEIVSLEYLSQDLMPDTFLEKFSAVDVRCVDTKGRQFLVEMQMNWTTAFKQRVLFNAAKAYVTQSAPGKKFSTLKPVYALNLINQNFLPESPDFYHHYAVVHIEDTEERLEGLEFVFVELEKFKAGNIAEKKLQVLWLRFLTEINESTENIDQTLLNHPEIGKAIQQVEEASLNKEDRYLYEKNWDRISSEKTILTAAEEKGKADGEKIKAYKIALESLKNGLEAEMVAKITQLSTETINKLKDLLKAYGDEAGDRLEGFVD